MNIEELYKTFNLKPNKDFSVNIELKKFSLVYESIVDERDIYNITFENITGIEDIITEKGAFSNKGVPTVIYELKHKKNYPFYYHMFWCDRLKNIYGNNIEDFKYEFGGSYSGNGKFNVECGDNKYEEEIQHHICKDCYLQLAEHYGGIQKFRKICGFKIRSENVTYYETHKFSLEKFYSNISNGKIKGIEGITNVDSFRRFRKEPY